MRTLLFSLMALLFTVTFTATPAGAHSFQSGPLKIGHPWTTASTDKNGMVYLSFMNTGDKADQLTGASTSIARKATLWQGAPDGSSSAVNVVDLPPNRGVSFRPGASYIKLEDLKGGLTTGDKFTLRLTFASAPPVDVTVFVEEQPAH